MKVFFKKAINITLISVLMFMFVCFNTSFVSYADDTAATPVATGVAALATKSNDDENKEAGADVKNIEEEIIYTTEDGKELTIEDLIGEFENKDVAFNIGVSRDGERYKNNVKYFNTALISLFKVFFSFAVFIAVLYAGIATILKNQDAKARAEYIDRFKNILFGVILFALIILIANLATVFQQESMDKVYQGQVFDDSIINELDDALEANVVSQTVEVILTGIAELISWLIKILMNLLGGNLGGIFKGEVQEFSINDAVFLSYLGDDLNINAEKNDILITTAPFTVTEWDKYTTVYAMLAGLFIPFLLVALIKTSYELVIGAGNFERISEAKKTILRIVVGIVGIVLGPYLFRLLLTVFNMLVFLIPAKFVSYNFETITGNGIISLVTIVWWRFINFRILLTMVVREIMLTVMYLSTPIVIGFWTISNKFKSGQLWLGETLSNAATQFCYALTLFITTILIHGGQGNPFFVLLWLTMVIKIGNFFKDSLQGLLSKWGGIDESGVADSIAGKVKSWSEKATDSFIKEVDENTYYKGTRGVANAMGFIRFASTGDLGGFRSEGKSIRKYGKSIKQSGNEELQISSNLRRVGGGYDTAIQRDSTARRLHELFDELDGLIDENEINDKLKEIDKLKKDPAAQTKHAQTVITARESYREGMEKLGVARIHEARGKHIQKKVEAIQGTINYFADRKEDQFKNFVNVYGAKENSRRHQLSKKKMELIQELNDEYYYSQNKPAVFEKMQRELPTTSILGDPRTRRAEKELLENVQKIHSYGTYVPDSYSGTYGKSTVTFDKNKVAEIAQIPMEDIRKPEAQVQLAKERKKYMDEIKNQVEEIQDAIEIQKESKSRNVPQEVITQHMDATNNAVEKHINSMVDLKAKGVILPDNEVYKELGRHIRNVDINGEKLKANELRNKIRIFLPKKDEDKEEEQNN